MSPLSPYARFVALLILLLNFHAFAAENADSAADIYKDASQPVEARIADLLPRLTLDEKIELIGGASFMTTHAIPRLGIPEFRMSDGPFGVRDVNREGSKQVPTRVYAGGMALAASWDAGLAHKVGAAIGRDCRARGINIFLGPGMNLYRAPFSGRNFEYFGEDPLLTGVIASGYIQGVQSQGVAATMKHFVANEQELNRHNISSDVDERTLRELYLKPFEMAVEAGVWCAMDSYNPINGIHATENDWLNNKVLKGDWGFKGVLMSDWWSMVSTLASANGGLDLEMPGKPQFFKVEKLKPLIDSGQVTMATVDDKVRRIFRVVFSMGWMDRPQFDSSIPMDDPQSDQVTLEGAREGITLLKNTGNLLPLNLAKVKKIVVLGRNADPAIAVGGGSAHIDYMHGKSLLDGLKELAGDGVEIIRIPWSTMPAGTDFSKPSKTPFALTAYGAPGNPALPQDFVDAIKSADAAVICVGFNDNVKDYWQSDHARPDAEGEDIDRTYQLPPGQVEVVKAVCKLNPKVVVVLNAGGSVETKDWIGDVPVLLDAYYPGQFGGTAIAEVLFGKINPSGKLPFSWETGWEDSAAYGHFPTASSKDNTYKEGVFLGYRWFDSKGIEPLFPFGLGLSYTKFEYSELDLQASGNGDFKARFTVTNKGDVAGAEVAQLYVVPPQASVPRPVHELKGFTRLDLQPGESKSASIVVAAKDLGYWDSSLKKWKVTAGKYKIEVGSSSRDLSLLGEVAEAAIDE